MPRLFHRPPRYRRIACVLAALVLPTTAVAASLAKDARGCGDPANLKRFEGASIVMCEQHDFAEYTLPTGPAISFDFDTKRASFEASLSLEGRLVQTVYAVPAGPASAEVFRNYKAELDAKGFRPLFEARQADTGPAMGTFFESMGPGTQLWGYSPDEARYIAAARDEAGAKTYAALYVIQYDDGYEPRFSPKKGQVMVRLDVLETGQLQNRMVVVSAAEIDRGLATAGKVALYGITFDFNQAVIKPESRPTLDEIGRFLNVHPQQKIYVIGHTDSAGGFDFNMQLSKARAAAVVADLAGRYGIAADRMMASGVGLQAPVAPNTTEEGRAKNRRVELLPR